MRDVCADFGAELREFNGGAEHVYLVGFPLTAAISRLVNSPKGMSSRRLRQEFPDLRRHYWRTKRSGPGSYFAGPAGGAPISVLHQYIEQQNHHARPAHVRPPSPPARRAGTLAAILVAAARLVPNVRQ